MTAPVVDHVKRSVIEEIKSQSPFNLFNIVAVIVIVIVGYVLYKKFTEKFQSGAIKIPNIINSEFTKAPVVAVAPVVVEEVQAEDPKEE
jgi:hypothetical protein